MMCYLYGKMARIVIVHDAKEASRNEVHYLVILSPTLIDKL